MCLVSLMKNQNMPAHVKSPCAISRNVHEKFLPVLPHKLPAAHIISYRLVNTELFSFHNEQNIIFSMNMKDLACIFFLYGSIFSFHEHFIYVI